MSDKSPTTGKRFIVNTSRGYYGGREGQNVYFAPLRQHALPMTARQVGWWLPRLKLACGPAHAEEAESSAKQS